MVYGRYIEFVTIWLFNKVNHVSCPIEIPSNLIKPQSLLVKCSTYGVYTLW